MLEAALVQRLAPLAPYLYPLRAPKNYAQPCTIYNLLHCDPVRSVDSGASEWAHYVVQIDTYSESYKTAHDLARAIRDNLVEWTSDDVQSVAWTGTTPMIDDTTDVALFRAMSTYLIFAKT